MSDTNIWTGWAVPWTWAAIMTVVTILMVSHTVHKTEPRVMGAKPGQV